MFDIGFSEIVVIAVVALVVIGPEKLPRTARTLGHLFGRLQRYVNDVKSDINREIELDELKKLQEQVKTAAMDLKTSVNSAIQKVETEAKAVETELNTSGDATPSPPVSPSSLPALEEPPGSEAPTPAALPPAGGASADSPPQPSESAEPPRQSTLPGFERG